MNGDFADNPVFICERCGRGFLVWPGARDPDPVWAVLSTREQGEDCFGRIVTKRRSNLNAPTDGHQNR